MTNILLLWFVLLFVIILISWCCSYSTLFSLAFFHKLMPIPILSQVPQRKTFFCNVGSIKMLFPYTIITSIGLIHFTVRWLIDFVLLMYYQIYYASFIFFLICNYCYKSCLTNCRMLSLETKLWSTCYSFQCLDLLLNWTSSTTSLNSKILWVNLFCISVRFLDE